jgi:hypothetical protein
MIKTSGQIKVITCDKCGYSESAFEKNADKIFFQSGWGMNPKAKKYVHLCLNCQTRHQRKAHDFLKEKFL